MGQQRSKRGEYEDSASVSPKRRKIRAKYAPKACVSCRRSKLKCSGENPCRRCQDSSRRCFYSEDQTAAEALQNLSQPGSNQRPTQQSIGNGPARQDTLQRDRSVSRRISNATSMGTSMETRMARIETMMEALIDDRGITLTPQERLEREYPPHGGPFVADTYSMNLVPVEQQEDFSHIASESHGRHSGSMQPATDLGSSILVGHLNLPFPAPDQYQKYIDYFFSDVNIFHPCVDEVDFRAKSQQIFSLARIPPPESGFLALNFVIFACVDILDTGNEEKSRNPRGWQWYQAADELVRRRKFNGQGGLVLLQMLVFEAIYLTTADMPNSAYTSIGLACRLCFQLGLHQQSLWDTLSLPEVHSRQCIFWTMFVLDRQIALSCRRPYGIRDSDINVELPHGHEVLYIDRPLGHRLAFELNLLFLNCMVSWAKFAGEVWDHIFALSSEKHGACNDADLDARIHHFTETILPTLMKRSTGGPSDPQRRQEVIIYTRLNHLRLLVHHQQMTTLSYDTNTGRVCADLALNTLERVALFFWGSESHPSCFRFYLTAGLSSTIMTLATLLVRDLGSLGLKDRESIYADRFKLAVELLQNTAVHYQGAHRMLDDLKDIVGVVMTIVDGGPPERLPLSIKDIFPYVLSNSTAPTNIIDEGNSDGTWEGWELEVNPGVRWI